MTSRLSSSSSHDGRASRSGRAFLSVAVASLLVLAACSGGEDDGPAAAGRTPDQIGIVVRNDVDVFNPYKSQLGSGARQIFDGIYETLVREGGQPDDGGVVPALAESWRATPRSATFVLKPGLKCADGSPLTASGVAESLRYFADPKTAATFASSVFGPSGASDISGDDTTREVVVKLKAPFSEMLNGMAAYGYIVCPTVLDTPGSLDNAPAETGPYELTASDRGESYTLTRRTSGVATDVEALPREVEVRVSTDDTTRANLFDTRAVDIAMILGRDAQRLEKKYRSIEGKAYEGYAILFNHAPGRAGADREVRRALSMAVDPAAYTRAATFGLGKPVDTLYTPNVDCYAEENGRFTPRFDADAAAAALDKITQERGERLTIRLVADDSQNSGPEYVADAWTNAGVSVELREGTFGQLVDIVYGTGDWDAVIYPTHTVTRSAASQVDVFSDVFTKSARPEHVANRAFDEAVTEAVAAQSEDRCMLWRRSEAALLEEADVKPLMWPAVHWFTHGLTFTGSYTIVDLRSIRSAADG